MYPPSDVFSPRCCWLCKCPLVKESTRHHGRALCSNCALPALSLCPAGYPISLMQNYSVFFLFSPVLSITPPFFFGRFLPHWHLFQGMMNQALEQLPQFAFPEPACSVCIKNISTKSQQGVKGNRISHLKANDVLPSEQELWILIFWLLSHLYNFQLLLNEGRLVPIMWYYIITMLVLKASYFTPSTCGCSARMKALMCQLAFRFCIRKSLILETYLSIPCGWAQRGLGSRRAAWGACCPRQTLCCSQRLGINITERARAELFPQSVHIMDVNVKMPPSEVWAPWNKTKNYWRCQLSGMLFRGGGKLHTQHQLSSASSFLIKGWPQALSLHRQSYTDLS